MPRTKTLLAQQIADRLALASPPCSQDPYRWNEAERAAEEGDEYNELLVAVTLRTCTACPVSQACAAWAEADQYTGLAAGARWTNGTMQPQAAPLVRRAA